MCSKVCPIAQNIILSKKCCENYKAILHLIVEGVEYEGIAEFLWGKSLI